MSLLEEVDRTVAALGLDNRDAAAVALARGYAQALDGLEPAERMRLIGQIGPSLLRVLEALGATPVARQKKPDKPVETGGVLAALRQVAG